eukprot:CAMPEP_0117021274 /NCGR_PEP_ID=MMETSP0472-20121206/16065_1 /TAXON_ID=693140 ORGANISM="Tiarina fusus, Strain LIS" /NCGR_SAMPLE_ID=MMETSP0472 /ASSEMBLY_ACC=CAM_ASM_000603 /LENGTH=213 /DNA_ID=CAMNT_0004726701 /DNA_START=98 /DNA_END=739 /DNA_ORIENTATION=+
MVASIAQSGKVSVDTMETSSSSEDNATSRARTKRKVFPFDGAALPSEQSKSIWNFYNPFPTRIARPELEVDRDDWKEFLDGVDEILVPVNKSRTRVFAMTCFAVVAVLFLVVGLFTFAETLWTENDLLLMAIYVLIGFSIIPVTLLLTIRLGVPSRVHAMEDRMNELCSEEANKRSESGRGKWKIRFNDRGERGYQVEVSMSEFSSPNLCDMA